MRSFGSGQGTIPDARYRLNPRLATGATHATAHPSQPQASRNTVSSREPPHATRDHRSARSSHPARKLRCATHHTPSWFCRVLAPPRAASPSCPMRSTMPLSARSTPHSLDYTRGRRTMPPSCPCQPGFAQRRVQRRRPGGRGKEEDRGGGEQRRCAYPTAARWWCGRAR